MYTKSCYCLNNGKSSQCIHGVRWVEHHFDVELWFSLPHCRDRFFDAIVIFEMKRKSDLVSAWRDEFWNKTNTLPRVR